MNERKDKPKWPDSLPDPISGTFKTVNIFLRSDFACEDDIKELIDLIYNNPEHETYLYITRSPEIQKLLKLFESHGILGPTSEFHFYKRPGEERSFFRIGPHEINT